MANTDMNICTISGATPLEDRTYACELEPGDLTHSGVVEKVTRLDNGKTIVVFTNGGVASVKDTTTFHTAL